MLPWHFSSFDWKLPGDWSGDTEMAIGFFQKNLEKGLKQNKWTSQNLYIRNSMGIKFQLKLTILIFWTKLTQKGISNLNRTKDKNHHRVLHILQVPNFSFNKQFWFLETIFANKDTSKRKQKKLTSALHSANLN